MMVHNEGVTVARDTLQFTKLHGAGNDFILADGNDLPLDERAGTSAGLCRRRLSVGADGLILVTKTGAAAVDVDFYNPDGSQAEMCGNGSRCAARFAVEVLGVENRHVMKTVAGTLAAEYRDPEHVKVVMPAPERLRLAHAEVKGHVLHHIVVGVPHTVVFVDDVSTWDDERLRTFGRRLRYDRDLYPAGTNLNIASPLGDTSWRVRTYERGVEDITLACGTGNTATACIASQLGRSGFPFESVVDGGSLTIEHADGGYWLVGPARVVMSGTISREALLGD